MHPPAKEGQGLLTKPKLEEGGRASRGNAALCTLISTSGYRVGRMDLWCLKLPDLWCLVLAAPRHRGS